jgi:hypothetical protein
MPIRRFSHGCYVLIQLYPSLVGKSVALFSPIHQSSIPCERTVHLSHPWRRSPLEYPTVWSVTGLCAHWAWITQSRTGHPGSHCGTQASLISGAYPEHPISRCAASRLAREEGGYMDAQVPVDLI